LRSAIGLGEVERRNETDAEDDVTQVQHATLVIERTYEAAPARVFAAWADPAAHGSWNVPGRGWALAESEHDFRVGGREYSAYRPPVRSVVIVS
jgi:uncharacterized protein YndB with AHSA1/START domain